jgi:hypothetical protein
MLAAFPRLRLPVHGSPLCRPCRKRIVELDINPIKLDGILKIELQR